MADVAAEVLYTREEILRRVADLGRAITEDYRDREPVLVAVLKGSWLFLADLVREIGLPLAVDFMSISSYGTPGRQTGVVRILKDLDRDIGGRDVIVVEDIVDTGLTMSYLLATLRSRQPASIEVCALLDKSARRIAPLEIRYRGFDCPDRFVIGYGLDHGERYRNLADIVAIDDPEALVENPDALLHLLDGRPGTR